MTYFPKHQPNVINYSNELVTFPMWEVIGDLTVNSFRFTSGNVIVVSGGQNYFNSIQLGWYILFSTGTQTSELRKIVGISKRDRRLAVDQAFTINAQDSVLKIIKPIPEMEFCLYNDGNLNIYLNGEIIAVDTKIFWTKTENSPPVIIYGSGNYKLSNGDIDLLGSSTSTTTAHAQNYMSNGTNTQTFTEFIGYGIDNMVVIVTGAGLFGSQSSLSAAKKLIISWDTLTGVMVFKNNIAVDNQISIVGNL